MLEKSFIKYMQEFNKLIWSSHKHTTLKPSAPSPPFWLPSPSDFGDLVLRSSLYYCL